MENQNDNCKKEDNNSSLKSEKLAWQKPELTELSVSQTHSGTSFIVPGMEGSFYSPS